MAFGLFKIVKGLLIKKEDTLNPDSIEIIPNGTAGTKTTVASSQTSNRTVTLPNATTTLVGTDATQTLTNKTIDADQNTITNIENADIKAGAAIDATKIGTGTVDNTEFGYLSNVTSDIQTQLNSKEPSITTLPIAKGGTNSSTALSNNRVMQSSAGAIVEAAAITASRALISDANGIPTHSSVTSTELGHVSGVTSAIQTQLNGKLNDTGDTMTGDLNMSGTQRVTNMADPSSAQDAATKQYVDNIAAGLDPKESVRVATTANLGATYATTPNNGRFTSAPSTIDGVALSIGDRVLVKDQLDAKQNGIYVYTAANQLTRSSDMDGSPTQEVSAGNYTFTTAGSVNVARGYVITGNGVLTLNTDNINWTQFSGASNAALRDLSNLTSPTAINQNLLPDTDNTRNIGSGAARFNTVNTQNVTNTGANLTLTSTTGKVVVSGTSLNLPSASTDPGTPAEDDLYYNTALDKFKYHDGTQWRQVATKDESNFILNGYAESSTTGWAAYADAAQATPVDGTGGSPNVTIAASATTPLSGQNSFIITKDAANRQGQGVSYNFTIDDSSKSKVLQIQFDYLVNSGTFVTGGAGVDSDITVWVYDVTNARLIQPTTYKLFGASSVVADKFISNFQSSADSNSYRLIFHCSTTSASAYSLKIDNVVVSPTTLSYGTPITDWQTYTPTYSNLGTPTTAFSRFRRVGADAEVDIVFTPNSAPAAKASISLPPGISLDSSYPSSGSLYVIGSWVQNNAGAGTAKQGVILADPAVPGFSFALQETANAQSPTIPLNASSFVSANEYQLRARFRVQGWSAQVQSSDINDQRIVSVVAHTLTSTTVTSGSPLQFTTETEDTHAAYASGIFTVPVSGTYEIKTFLPAITAGAQSIYISRNGAAFSASGAIVDVISSYGSSGSVTIPCVAGDTLRLIPNASFTFNTTNGNISITRVANPASITSTETVAASYWASSNKSISTTIPADFDSKDYDTHNAVTTGASWKFTAPIRGVYSISGLVNGTSGTYNLRLYKNGVFYKPIAYIASGSVVGIFSNAIQLNAGDYIDLRSNGAANFGGGSLAVDGTSNITIQKIGI